MRRDRLIHEREHDPYKARKSLPEPTVCTGCGATFREGRWTWIPAPADAHRALCPADQRIRDQYPAGYVTLRGDFLKQHRAEILGLARNIEEREKAQHPLNRIMQVEDGGDSEIVVTTTNAHLARTLGEAIHSAYQGKLDFHYVEQDSLIRVLWER